jgi:hypothetical protein
MNKRHIFAANNIIMKTFYNPLIALILTLQEHTVAVIQALANLVS